MKKQILGAVLMVSVGLVQAHDDGHKPSFGTALAGCQETYECFRPRIRYNDDQLERWEVRNRLESLEQRERIRFISPK